MNRSKTYFKFLFIVLLLFAALIFPNSGITQIETHIRKKAEITENLSPKSIITNGQSVFAAQNMMYRHTVHIYDEKGRLKASIKDAVNLNEFGFDTYESTLYRGAPVEGVFSVDGQYLWVSNYQMYGRGFDNPGCDQCIGKNYDPSFIYKINLTNYKIENAIKVGAVPKFMAIGNKGDLLIVSNWVSSDISIIDLKQEKEIKRIDVGPHPRGIAINRNQTMAYVTIMGSTKIAKVDLRNYSVSYIQNIGKAPRSLLLINNDSTLIVSNNSSNEIIRLDLFTESKTRCKTPAGPRSMTISEDEKWLYVVNYFDNSFSKIDVTKMEVVATVSTADKPIGICGDWKNGEIWVACYSGKIEIFKDFKLPIQAEPSFTDQLLASIWNTETIIQIDNELKENIPTEPKNESAHATPEKVELEEKVSKESCNFHVIIGAFGVHENALNKKAELIGEHPQTAIIKGKYNYVSIGCYPNEKVAEKMRDEIRTSIPGCESAWILKQ